MSKYTYNTLKGGRNYNKIRNGKTCMREDATNASRMQRAATYLIAGTGVVTSIVTIILMCI